MYSAGKGINKKIIREKGIWNVLALSLPFFAELGVWWLLLWSISFIPGVYQGKSANAEWYHFALVANGLSCASTSIVIPRMRDWKRKRIGRDFKASERVLLSLTVEFLALLITFSITLSIALTLSSTPVEDAKWYQISGTSMDLVWLPVMLVVSFLTGWLFAWITFSLFRMYNKKGKEDYKKETFVVFFLLAFLSMVLHDLSHLGAFKHKIFEGNLIAISYGLMTSMFYGEKKIKKRVDYNEDNSHLSKWGAAAFGFIGLPAAYFKIGMNNISIDVLKMWEAMLFFILFTIPALATKAFSTYLINRRSLPKNQAWAVSLPMMAKATPTIAVLLMVEATGAFGETFISILTLASMVALMIAIPLGDYFIMNYIPSKLLKERVKGIKASE